MYLVLRNYLMNTGQCPVFVTDEETQSWSAETVCGEKHGWGNDPELYQAIVFVVNVALPLIQPGENTVINVLDAYSRRDKFIAAKKRIEAVNQLNEMAAEKAIAEQRTAMMSGPAVNLGPVRPDDVAGAKIIPFGIPGGKTDAEIDPTKAAPSVGPVGDPEVMIPAPNKPEVFGSGLKPIVQKGPKDKDDDSGAA